MFVTPCCKILEVALQINLGVESRLDAAGDAWWRVQSQFDLKLERRLFFTGILILYHGPSFRTLCTVFTI